MTNGQTNWTVMVYFAGDNNLGEEMIWSLKDIHAATPLKNAKVVALFDGGGPPVTFRIDREDPDKPVHKVSAQDGDRQILRQVDSARKSAAERKTPRRSEPIRATLTNFIKQNISDDPYERYMLILSGHGGGAVGEFLTSDKRILGLSIPALQSVLGEVRKEFPGKDKKFDVLGLDSCQMSMAEVAYQVRNDVDFMVGAEGFEPNTGWPYDRVLRLLDQEQNIDDPSILVKNIVTEYIRYYLDYSAADRSTDASALDLSTIKIKRLESALLEFTTALDVTEETKEQRLTRQALPQDQQRDYLTKKVDATKLKEKPLLDAIVLAHWEAQGYKSEQYTDLWDFCKSLIPRLDNLQPLYPEQWFKNLRHACQAIKDAIAPEDEKEKGNGLVRQSGYGGAAFQHSHGLSVFFPWANLTDAAGIADLEHYQLLEFAQDTAWDEFLRLYMHATQRPPRADNPGATRHTSLLNRRTGLFTGKPGRDSDLGAAERDSDLGVAERDSDLGAAERGKLGNSSIPPVKNPPIDWVECKLD